MNETQQTAPERMWIDSTILPGIDAYAERSESSDTEYIRADLQNSPAIEFARWVSKETYMHEGLWCLNETLGSRFPLTYSLWELYPMFLEERDYESI